MNFPQHRTEELLHDALVESGLVELRHGRTVTGVRQDAHSATVEVDGQAGPERYRGAYLVAADGVGSTLRG